MNKKIYKVIAIVVSILFVLGIAAPLMAGLTYAAPTDQKLQEYESKVSAALKDLKALEQQLNQKSEEIYQLEVQMEKTHEIIAETEKELAVAEELKNERWETFKDRFAVLCESGIGTYLEMIFSAKSFSEFIEKVVIVREFVEYDNSVMDSMEQVMAEIQAKKDQQELLLADQEKTKNDLTSSKEELDAKTREASEYFKKLEADKNAYQQYLLEKEAEERRTKEKAGIVSGGNADVSGIPSGSFLWPTNTTYITSHFSPNRVNPVTGVLRAHTGTDIGASHGAPIWAAKAGTVILAEENGGYGNCVIISHGNGVTTLYGHMSALLVQKGQTVSQGTQIGRCGSTGNSTGPHLHFEVLVNGTAVDPMQFF